MAALPQHLSTKLRILCLSIRKAHFGAFSSSVKLIKFKFMSPCILAYQLLKECVRFIAEIDASTKISIVTNDDSDRTVFVLSIA